MKIAFVYSEGRESRLAAAAAGQLPTDFFYGAMELAKAGHQISYCQIKNSSANRFAGGLDGILGRWMPARFRITNVFSAWSDVPAWNRVDCVVAANSQVGMSLGFFRKLGRLKTPVVAIHCGIVNWEHAPWRRKITHPLLTQQQIVLFADTESQAMSDAFSISKDSMRVCPFGVDVDFWHPSDVAPEFVLAVGNDGRRDFDTFAKSAARVAYPHRLLSRLSLNVPPPPNLEHISGHWSQSVIDDITLREWYRQSLCVVVPLSEAVQPSGQSVALQAMACGRPVIITRTSGYWLHPDFKDGEHLLVVEPGSTTALSAAVNRLVSDPVLAHKIGAAGRDLMLQHYSITKFARGIEAACRHALGHSV